MEIGELVLISAIAIWAFMSASYLISLYIKNASLVDIAWGIGPMIVVLAVQSAVGEEVTPASLTVWALVMIWGARLALHISTRFKPDHEDWRYMDMRQRWGSGFWWKSYFKIFMFQGLLMLVMSMPIITSVFAESVADWKIMLGAAIWSVGFFFEAVGDWQLKRFIATKKKKGAIMTSGLWKYTRHPNYFGEVTMWWGIFIILAFEPYWCLAILNPMLITFLLLKISGITMLEKKWEGNKQWEKYKSKTSAFFPMPPKK